MPKHSLMTPKQVAKLLAEDDWTVKRKGPGNHVQYHHPTKPGKVTLDMGVDTSDRHASLDLPAGPMDMVGGKK